MRPDYSRDSGLAKWGSGVSLHGSNPEPFMSALGQKRTFRSVRRMSAIPPKADIRRLIGSPRRREPSDVGVRFQSGYIRAAPLQDQYL